MVKVLRTKEHICTITLPIPSTQGKYLKIQSDPIPSRLDKFLGPIALICTLYCVRFSFLLGKFHSLLHYSPISPRRWAPPSSNSRTGNVTQVTHSSQTPRKGSMHAAGAKENATFSLNNVNFRHLVLFALKVAAHAEVSCCRGICHVITRYDA